MGDEPTATDALKRPALHQWHADNGAKFGEFGGWEMPLEYPSGVVAEHTAVREKVGLFDVSHLGKVLAVGEGAAAFINSTLSNDLAKIEPGKAQYTLCCDAETGGIIDDLIVYYQGEDRMLLIPNAANTAEVVRRLETELPESVKLLDHHDTYAVLAIQGTKSDEIMEAVGLPTGHGYMSFVEAEHNDTGVVVCRTGYTGERGYELIVHNDGAVPLWEALLAAGQEYGITPCGLGARDTLRTEMGYPLHGQDLTRDVTPNQGRVGWAVGWKKDRFWGKDVLAAEREAGPDRILRGIVAVGRGIPRPGMDVTLAADEPLGEVTSGTFSPTLKKGVGMALVSTAVASDAEVGVDIRGRREIFQLTKPPFVDTSVREE